MPLSESGEPMRGIHFVEGKRIKICFGHGKFELPVRNLSGDVKAMEYVRFSFPIYKMFRRRI